MAYNPAEQAKKNAQMTKGQMMQNGTLTAKQKQDNAAREQKQTNNARQAAERAQLAAGVGDAAGLTSTGGQLEYRKAISNVPVAKNTNVSSGQQNTAAREQAKGEAAAASKPASASTGGGDDWQGRIKRAQATDADMEKAFREWQAGRYKPGPKTLEYFKKMGWIQPANPAPQEKPRDTKASPDYNADYEKGYQQFHDQTHEWANTFDSINKQFTKMGYDPEQAKQLTDMVSREMYNLGRDGQISKQDLRKLQAKYGLKDISGAASDSQLAHLINKSQDRVRAQWTRTPDGSWKPTDAYNGKYGWF